MAMQNIEFRPTYLYIKQHVVTKKLYFGKTTGSEKYLLEQYNGSGRYWQRHIAKHGKKHIVTLWYKIFTDENELISFAKSFSRAADIVKVKDVNGKKIWANERPENGLDGCPKGIKKGQTGKPAWNRGLPLSEERKAAHSNKMKGKKKPERTKEHCSNISAAKKGRCTGRKDSLATRIKKSLGRTGKIRTEESKLSQSIAMKAKEKINCPHCGSQIGGQANFNR